MNRHRKTQHSEVCGNILRNATEVKLGMFDGLVRELIDADLVDDSSGALELTQSGNHQLVRYLKTWWNLTPYKEFYSSKLSGSYPDLYDVMVRTVPQKHTVFKKSHMDFPRREPGKEKREAKVKVERGEIGYNVWLEEKGSIKLSDGQKVDAFAKAFRSWNTSMVHSIYQNPSSPLAWRAAERILKERDYFR